MAKTNSKITIKIPSRIREVKKVSRKIIDSLKDYRVGDDIVFDIRLSTEEALRNAINHGNKNETALPVNVSFSVNEDVLEIEIEDKGAGFDHNNIPDPTTEENILKTSGRGVFLIRHLMDEVHYNNKGNKIRMVKYLRG